MKAKKTEPKKPAPKAAVRDQSVEDILTENYMPYAMSVIVSRAIPSIDGFKPSHRKLLYTMYKMGLLTGNRTKSANIVGQTMRLNPHGDAAIYETMVRLTRANESLLMPFVDSKGNFGKTYSRDMAYAAPRYTEAKLEKICAEFFSEIGKSAVPMVPNYDNTMEEPELLPTTFPNILVSANNGIAVGMASSFPGFCFSEVCRATAEYIKNPKKCDILSLLPAPDFPTGGIILRNPEEMASIYQTGRGVVRVRSVWQYNKKENLVEVTEIPYSTSIEAIMEKIADLMKAGKCPGISDVRDESDKGGLRLVIDLKRGVDHVLLMAFLMKNTPLEDSFVCNFNLLINGMPKVLGITAIMDEWVSWRLQVKERVLNHEKNQLEQRLHLLEGLAKILLNINKAIKIIRETEDDTNVVPNLMAGFKIDRVQAEYVADIRLRNINKDYILKQTAAVDDLKAQIDKLEKLLASKSGLKGIIAKELLALEKKYPSTRRSRIEDVDGSQEAVAPVNNEPVKLLFSNEGYFKKLDPKAAAKDQKWKDGDETAYALDARGGDEIIFLSDKAQAYKMRLDSFAQGAPGQPGLYAPSVAEMDSGERLLFGFLPGDKYKGYLAVGYENGKVSLCEVADFETKTNRKCLKNAYGAASAPVGAAHVSALSASVYVETDMGRKVAVPVRKLSLQKRGAIGVQTLALRKGEKMTLLRAATQEEIEQYTPKKKPKKGAER